MSGWQRWEERLAYVVSMALFAAGMNLLSFSSLWLFLLSLSLILGGIGGISYRLVRSSQRDGRSWKSNLAIVLVSTTLGLLAIAWPLVFMRMETPGARWQRFDSELGWVQDTDEEIGQRLDKIDPTREHVVFIGDSILYGHGVADDETAAHYLEAMIPPYQVLNGSVSGWSIDQYYLYLRRLLPRTRPKLVVIGIYSGNDFEITSRGYGWGHSKPLFIEQDGTLVRLNPDLMKENCIDRVAGSLLFKVVWQNHDYAQILLDRLCNVRQLDLEEGERAIAAMFREMDRLATEAGSKILYVLLPEQRNFVGHASNSESFEFYYNTMYRRLRRLLRDGGHNTFEVAPDLARSRIPFWELFLDQGHFRPAGQKVLAEALQREIESRNLLR